MSSLNRGPFQKVSLHPLFDPCSQRLEPAIDTIENAQCLMAVIGLTCMHRHVSDIILERNEIAYNSAEEPPCVDQFGGPATWPAAAKGRSL